MKFFKKRFAGIFFLLLLAACAKEHGTDATNNGGNPATEGPLFTDVKAVLQVNCALSGCHAGSSPQSGIDFTNETQIIVQKERIKLRAVDQAGTVNQMPPPPMAPLSAADQKKITDWVSAGGKLTD